MLVLTDLSRLILAPEFSGEKLGAKIELLPGYWLHDYVRLRWRNDRGERDQYDEQMRHPRACKHRDPGGRDSPLQGYFQGATK